MNNCSVDISAVKKYLELVKILKTVKSFEHTYNKCSASLRPGTSPLV